MERHINSMGRTGYLGIFGDGSWGKSLFYLFCSHSEGPGVIRETENKILMIPFSSDNEWYLVC